MIAEGYNNKKGKRCIALKENKGAKKNMSLVTGDTAELTAEQKTAVEDVKRFLKTGADDEDIDNTLVHNKINATAMVGRHVNSQTDPSLVRTLICIKCICLISRVNFIG